MEFIFICVYLCEYRPHVCGTLRGQRRHKIPWRWSYKCLLPTWVLGLKLASSGRAESALSHRVISPAPAAKIFKSIIPLLSYHLPFSSNFMVHRLTLSELSGRPHFKLDPCCSVGSDCFPFRQKIFINIIICHWESKVSFSDRPRSHVSELSTPFVFAYKPINGPLSTSCFCSALSKSRY